MNTISPINTELLFGRPQFSKPDAGNPQVVSLPDLEVSWTLAFVDSPAMVEGHPRGRWQAPPLVDLVLKVRGPRLWTLGFWSMLE